MTKTTALLLTTALALGACSDDGGSTDAFCQVVEERWVTWEPTDLDALLAESDGLEEAAAAADEIARESDNLRADTLEAASGDLRDDLQTMFDSDPNSVDLDEQEAYEEAQERVNEIIREDCRLDFGL